MRGFDFNIAENFWVHNPELKFPEQFRELYDTDKSKDKKDSSQIMWAIALLEHPKSKFFNLSYKERKILIANDFLRNKDFKWDSIASKITFFQKFILSAGERQLALWSKLMDQKTEYLQTLTYSNDADIIEKLLTSNSKLYSELERISEQLEKEGSEGEIAGGAMESASEKGDL